MKATQHGLTFLPLVNSDHVRHPRINGDSAVFELVSAYGGVGLSLGVPYVSSPTLFHMDALTMNTPGWLLLLGRAAPTF